MSRCVYLLLETTTRMCQFLLENTVKGSKESGFLEETVCKVEVLGPIPNKELQMKAEYSYDTQLGRRHTMTWDGRP